MPDGGNVAALLWRRGHTLWRACGTKPRASGSGSATHVTLSWAKYRFQRPNGNEEVLLPNWRGAMRGARGFESAMIGHSGRDRRGNGPPDGASVGHGLKLGGLSLERADVIEREALDVRAGARSIAPERDEFTDLLDREIRDPAPGE